MEAWLRNARCTSALRREGFGNVLSLVGSQNVQFTHRLSPIIPLLCSAHAEGSAECHLNDVSPGMNVVSKWILWITSHG